MGVLWGGEGRGELRVWVGTAGGWGRLIWKLASPSQDLGSSLETLGVTPPDSIFSEDSSCEGRAVAGTGVHTGRTPRSHYRGLGESRCWQGDRRLLTHAPISPESPCPVPWGGLVIWVFAVAQDGDR